MKNKNIVDLKIIHHGAVDGVTGSCHQLFFGSGEGDFRDSILIDCGLFQGAELATDRSEQEQLKISFPVDNIKALVVTHVHIDHVGRIPYLLAAGFRGPIYCSQPSAELLPLVLEDALKIGFTRNRRLIERFLVQIEKQIRPLDYKRWKKIDPSLKIKLQPAGHILGSAYVECEVKGERVKGQGKKSKTRVVFSGDLGATYSPLLAAPRSPYRSDLLVLESTYGDRLHQGRRDRRKSLARVINRAVENRGVVLIPAFSIGRTQEVLYEIEELLHRENIEDIEVIIDSPLAAKFTAIYRRLKKYWDREAKRKLRRGRHPLAFDQLWTVDEHKDHLQTVNYLKKTARPTIVIAASGMCSGGRIVNYLKALIEDERTDIFFVGYQAQGTPGRTIQKYGSRKNGWVELEGKKYDINAEVHTISGYSAHADQRNLVNFIKRMRHKPTDIRLVHGDAEAKISLAAMIKDQLAISNVTVP
jgi:metallo-beta-lactamase family protein